MIALTADNVITSGVRVFISYAHDDAEHEERVRKFYVFLRKCRIDARIDLPDAERRQDWPMWMSRELSAATFVLVVASREYRRRAEGEAPTTEGRGVRWEAGLIRDQIYQDPEAALNRFLPVVLPGCSPDDIPSWMGRSSTTHYTISQYTVAGASKLLRLLTNQPYETVPPLGSMPLLSRRGDPGSPPIGENAVGDVGLLVRTLVKRDRKRNEATVQAILRQLLLAGDLGIDEDDLGSTIANSADDRRCVDVDIGLATFYVHSDLRVRGAIAGAERYLRPHLKERSDQADQRCVGIVTDGVEWLLYHFVGNELRRAASLAVDPANPNVDALLCWLEAVLATAQRIKPTPREVVRRLGAGSPTYALDVGELEAIYAKHKTSAAVSVKRRLWAKLLTTALGTNFADEDSLFVDHTLLVAMAKLIGHAVVGFRPQDTDADSVAILAGSLFADAHISGVIEADFFDWVASVPGGDQFIKGLSRRLSRFDWDLVEHDVMKVLYESIISPQTRHRLGEYYTPDWLAEEIVLTCVESPLTERVLDASCGSGTFLFHAVRRYIAAADELETLPADLIRGVVQHISGIDVHPVAVTLARVTYLLAMGMRRLQAAGRPPFTVPVYLGDALRWGQESTLFSYDGLSVSTADDYQLFANQLELADQLRFPDRVIGDADRFDRLVSELADLATQRRRGASVPSLASTFRRFAIHDDDRVVLGNTFKVMCRLHDEDRDHIWGYYVRNLARPLWLARPTNRIDVLVGNPPWLAYRYMTASQQVSFRTMSAERGLWAGSTVATNQDLSALFVERCIELYLRSGGRFGYVMPWATLSRRQYAGFRRAEYVSRSETVKVAFDRPWDLHKVKPSFFPVPACVVFGRRQHHGARSVPLGEVPEVWTGKFATATASRTHAAAATARTIGETMPDTSEESPYAARFSQGATVVPRMLFVVDPGLVNPLAPTSGRRPVRSRRSANEKRPWKDLDGLTGAVEPQFIRPLYLGDCILPFRALPPAYAVVPWDDRRFLTTEDMSGHRYDGLRKWWECAEAMWMRHRSSARLSLIEQLDYRRKLSQQFPAADRRVVYGASGMYLAAAIVSDVTAIIEHQLYWAAASSLDEARYLTAILNSTALTTAVRPLQARGEYNPRHFDKYVFKLPIPSYDPTDEAHRWLVSLSERSEEVVAGVDLAKVRFEAIRRRAREALVEDGVLADIDAIVKDLLA